MAKLLEAVRDYGPRVRLGPAAQLDEVIERMMPRTGLTKSVLVMVAYELSQSVAEFNGRGIPVKLPELGTFTPSVNREGEFRTNFRAAVELKRKLNKSGGYTGRVHNRERIGMDDAGYKGLWDADHPDDPLDV